MLVVQGQPPVWVRLGVDCGEVGNVDMGVDLSGFQSCVSKHFLHTADVCPILVHMRCTAVPERMNRPTAFDANLLEQIRHPGAEVGRCDRGSIPTEEKSPLPGLVHKHRACLEQKPVEPEGSALTHGQKPALAPFALPNQQGLHDRIVVRAVQAGQLGAADPGRVKQFKDGAIAQADGLRRIGAGENAREFLRAECPGQPHGLLAGEVEISRWVGGYAAQTAHPGKEPPHHPQSPELGVYTKWLPGSLADMLVQMKLVGQKIGADEPFGLMELYGICPLKEAPHGPIVKYDG